eukprot:244578_1
MSLYQANFGDFSTSSTINIAKYVKQLENDIDTFQNMSKENESEINHLRKEVINELNERFDELIRISNFKIFEKKHNILLQINDLKSHQKSLADAMSTNTQSNDVHTNKYERNINDYIINNKPTLTSTVNIEYNPKHMLDFIKNFGNVNETKIKYKFISNINSVQELRCKNEYEKYIKNDHDVIESNEYDIICNKNTSFADYITFDDLDIALNEFEAASDTKLKLKAFDKIHYFSSSFCRKILNSRLVKELHEILDSHDILDSYDIDIQLHSLSLLSEIDFCMVRNQYGIDLIFDENSIQILINIINNNYDDTLTYEALSTLSKLMSRFKPQILQNNILDSLLIACAYNVSNGIMKIVIELLLKLCTNNYDLNIFNIIYITKILQIFCILSQYITRFNKMKCIKQIETCLVHIYNFLNEINDNMQLFDGDIVIDSYSFVQNYNKPYFKLLISGFIRRDANEYVIPNDITSNCTIFLDYAAFPFTELMMSKQYSFLAKLWGKGINSTNNKRLLQVIKLIRKLIAVNDPNPPIQTVIDIGVIPKLIPFLQHDKNIDEKLQFESTWIITNICSGTEEQTQHIINIGAVPLLINLLKSTSYCIQEQAVWALGNIAANNVSAKHLVLNNDILPHFVFICKNYLKLQNHKQGICTLRNIPWVLCNLSRDRPRWEYIEQMIECLFYLLQTDDYEVLYQCGCLCNKLTSFISGDNDMLIITIKNMGFIKIFIDLLGNEIMDINHQMAMSITHILAKTNMIAEDILQQFVFICKNYLQLISDNYRQGMCILRTIACVLSNLAIGKTQQHLRWQYIEQNIKCLFYLLKINDIKILCKTGNAFNKLVNYISGDDDILITIMKNMGFIKTLIDLLENKSSNVQHYILIAMNGIFLQTNSLTKYAIKCGLFQKLHCLLKKDTTTSRCLGPICCLVSNIIAYSTKRTEQAIKANIFPLLIDILQNDEKNVAGEALWALSNVIDCGTDEQMSYLVNLNVIPVICEHLNRTTSNDVVLKLLNCLENILKSGEKNGKNEYKNYIKKCGGLETLQLMQSNDILSETIDETTVNIHETIVNILQYYV